MTTARQQVRDPLTKFISNLKKIQVDLKVSAALVHALREFAVECFEAGRKDLYEANTLPAPRQQREEEPPSGSYSYSGRRKPDKV